MNDKSCVDPAERHRKVAVITGVNVGGIGYGIAERLLELIPCEALVLVFACRSHTRANNVRQSFLNRYPHATIDLVTIDLNQFTSVMQACQDIQHRYHHVDYLFLNAGYLSALGLRWGSLVSLFLKSPTALMESSDATIQATGEINNDGLGKVFATNVFGHYVMIRQLESLLGNAKDHGRVIWTSSSTASSEFFTLDDWQGVKATLPYESSKWACDLLAVATNDYFMQQTLNIRSFTTSPGVVASHIGNLPLWVIYLRSLIHWLFRLFGLASQNINGYRGAMAAVFVALQPLVVLNEMLRYTSETTRWGESYVKPYVLHLEVEAAWELIDRVEHQYQALLAKSKQE
ncbi:NAD(P)-binding protein [Hesseltinella vesiculosa]|uniref:NAD(P)-binding protein n=1 Tax=Hesseltinella vesiculosa TaxID=101127 RepID=A0A1X2GT18_9FUNG|nr:NAD(P)-binding protein [Hesseltinella vesiculosa]